MAREVTDQNQVVWNCVEAYSGLSDSAENHEKAQVKGYDDQYWVVCTPEGSAQSVRLKLKEEWESSYSDEELLKEIEAQQEKDQT